MVTESRTETATTQKLEEALNQMEEPSAEVEKPAEETPTEDTKEIKEPTETKEEVEDTEEPSEPEGFKWTEEQQAEIDKIVESEADRKSNQENESYRKKLETSNEALRQRDTKIGELQKQLRGQASDKRFKTLVDGYTEEEGASEEDIKSFSERLKEHNQFIEKYEENYSRVEDVANFASVMAEQLNQGLVKDFELNHSDPVVRAEGALNLVTKTEEVLDRTTEQERVFLKVVGKFFPKGDEVRQKLDGIIKEMAGFGGNEKSEDIFLDSQQKGFVTRPRKAPPSPSQDGGGEDLSKLTPTERIQRGLDKMDKGK